MWYSPAQMKLIAPRYELVLAMASDYEWLFRESEEAFKATLEFDDILEMWRGTRELTSKLRKFLNRYPWHFDAMSHYAVCKDEDGRTLDALAFAQTAVSYAKAGFPADFEKGEHKIPGGFMENRPFLRSLYNLMTIQASIGDHSGAIVTGFEILDYDLQDRMGARLELPKYLLWEKRYLEIIQLFEDESFEDTFYTAEYLFPLALLAVGRDDDARAKIKDCLHKPRIAKYLLNHDLPQPEPERPYFGLISGSELEGFYFAQEYRPHWEASPKALEILRECSGKAQTEDWPSHSSRED